MDPKVLIVMLQNRISYNNQQRSAAFIRGDVAMVQFYDQDTASTTVSLNLLLEGTNG